MKICNTCKEVKALTLFAKSTRAKTGRRGQCKVCVNKRAAQAPATLAKKEYSRVKRAKALEEQLAKVDKECSKCNIVKPITHFHWDSSRRDNHSVYCNQCIKGINKTYNDKHVDNIKARNKIYRESHATEIAEKSKIYNIKNKDKLSEKHKAYYKKNKESILAKNKDNYYNASPEDIEARRIKKRKYNDIKPNSVRDRKKAYDKTYFQSVNGKDTIRRSTHKRRAKILSSEDGSITRCTLDTLLKKQCNLCYYCGCTLDNNIPRSIHLDHYIPLSKGGTHTLSNVVWSCASCNLKKSNKLVN